MVSFESCPSWNSRGDGCLGCLSAHRDCVVIREIKPLVF